MNQTAASDSGLSETSAFASGQKSAMADTDFAQSVISLFEGDLLSKADYDSFSFENWLAVWTAAKSGSEIRRFAYERMQDFTDAFEQFLRE